MHGCDFCWEIEKIELSMIDGPTSQGSIRMVKEPGNKPGDETGATGGLKTRRNEVSPLSDLTDSDMVSLAPSKQQLKSKRHERGQKDSEQALGMMAEADGQPERCVDFQTPHGRSAG